MAEPRNATYDERLVREFHDRSVAGRELEALVLIKIIVRTGRLVSEIVGEFAANLAFSALMRALGYKVANQGEWGLDLLTQALPDADSWPMRRLFHDLSCYAHWGVILKGCTADERKAVIIAQIKAVEAFMQGVPFDLWEIDRGDAVRTLAAAKGRRALERGHHIEPPALALLCGFSEGRIRNLMSSKKSTLQPVDGRIPGKAALRWLATQRTEFRRSRWQTDNDFDEPALAAAELNDVVFVPVAEDGTTFSPNVASEGRFVIGRGARRQTFEDYDEALRALQRLGDPAWRRRTLKGGWATVAVVRWERMSRAELERKADGSAPPTEEGGISSAP